MAYRLLAYSVALSLLLCLPRPKQLEFYRWCKHPKSIQMADISK